MESFACPSLKITRREDQTHANSFIFEVWSPFTASYQPVDSISDGLRRLHELADLIGQMRLRSHPKLEALTDVPGPDLYDPPRWAEFRINAMTYRSYDTRRYDRPRWLRVTGMVQAAEATCAGVGYVLPAV